MTRDIAHTIIAGVLNAGSIDISGPAECGSVDVSRGIGVQGRLRDGENGGAAGVGKAVPNTNERCEIGPPGDMECQGARPRRHPVVFEMTATRFCKRCYIFLVSRFLINRRDPRRSGESPLDFRSEFAGRADRVSRCRHGSAADARGRHKCRAARANVGSKPLSTRIDFDGIQLNIIYRIVHRAGECPFSGCETGTGPRYPVSTHPLRIEPCEKNRVRIMQASGSNLER